MTNKSAKELAQEYANLEGSGNETYEHGLRQGFLAGYKAAMDRQESYERELGIIKTRLDTAAQLYSLANEEKEQ